LNTQANIVENYRSLGVSVVIKFMGLIIAALFIPTLQGCSTSNAMGDGLVLAGSVNEPSGTSGCISPMIVTEEGKCKAAEKLSWMKN